MFIHNIPLLTRFDLHCSKHQFYHSFTRTRVHFTFCFNARSPIVHPNPAPSLPFLSIVNFSPPQIIFLARSAGRLMRPDPQSFPQVLDGFIRISARSPRPSLQNMSLRGPAHRFSHTSPDPASTPYEQRGTLPASLVASDSGRSSSNL